MLTAPVARVHTIARQLGNMDAERRLSVSVNKVI